ncbi:hypothetical protein ACJZ2D_013171 [Fusarium nematophilum]
MPPPDQCGPLDPGPPLPEPAGAHFLGADSHRGDPASMGSDWPGAICHPPRIPSGEPPVCRALHPGILGRHCLCPPTLAARRRPPPPSVGDSCGPLPPLARRGRWARAARPPASSACDSPALDLLPRSEKMRQPETRPISQDQLVAEVKGIYAGLVMVETKCLEVDNAQSSITDANSKLNNEQWQALIALHRTLLHEHHDFFLASQHPSASPSLRRLASKYAMPARMWRHGIHPLCELLLHKHHDFFLASQHPSASREVCRLASKYAMPASMWRHGIHSFLKLLRHQLPCSPEHTTAFLYLAYSMVALFCETVPSFEDTWIECLGDLGQYRMAIEDDDTRDREVWTGVGRLWYSMAIEDDDTRDREVWTGVSRLWYSMAIEDDDTRDREVWTGVSRLWYSMATRDREVWTGVSRLWYSMAIEDDDTRDREVWTGVSRLWYSKASDKSPTTGRLYHHLAILARPNVLQQLYYYSKTLCVIVPLAIPWESILTPAEPFLTHNSRHYVGEEDFFLGSGCCSLSDGVIDGKVFDETLASVFPQTYGFLEENGSILSSLVNSFSDLLDYASNAKFWSERFKEERNRLENDRRLWVQAVANRVEYALHHPYVGPVSEGARHKFLSPRVSPENRRHIGESPHYQPWFPAETPICHGPGDSRNWDNWISRLWVSRPILEDIARPCPKHEIPIHELPPRRKITWIWSCCCSSILSEVLVRIGVSETASTRPRPRPKPPVPLWPIWSTGCIAAYLLAPLLAISWIQIGILRGLSEIINMLSHIMAKNISNMGRHVEQLGNAGTSLRIL